MQRERTLKDVIAVLRTLDNECLKRRETYKEVQDWNEAVRMEQIRKGISLSIERVEKMLSGKLEVVF